MRATFAAHGSCSSRDSGQTPAPSQHRFRSVTQTIRQCMNFRCLSAAGLRFWEHQRQFRAQGWLNGTQPSDLTSQRKSLNTSLSSPGCTKCTLDSCFARRVSSHSQTQRVARPRHLLCLARYSGNSALERPYSARKHRKPHDFLSASSVRKYVTSLAAVARLTLALHVLQPAPAFPRRTSLSCGPSEGLSWSRVQSASVRLPPGLGSCHQPKDLLTHYHFVNRNE